MHRWLLLLLPALASCATSQQPEPKVPGSAAGDGIVATSAATADRVLRATGAAQESLLSFVPKHAKAVVILRRNAFKSLLDQVISEPDDMREELQRYLRRTVGDDLIQVESAVIFASRMQPDPAVAMFLRIRGSSDRPKLKGKVVAHHGGVALVRPPVSDDMLVAAQLPEGVVIGARHTVAMAIDLARGVRPPLAIGDPLGDLLRYDSPDIIALAGADLGSLGAAASLLSGFGARAATLTVTGTYQITLRVGGERSALEMGRAGLYALMGALLRQQEQQMREAVGKDDVIAGVSAILGYYRIRELVSTVEPKIEDDRLVSRITAPQHALGVGAVGIAAAVAVPAFVKYLRRAKTSEARGALELLQARVTSYYVQRARRGLRRFRFPKSTGWTPTKGCCRGASDKCPLDPRAFSHRTWRALDYTPTQAHYFQLRLTSKGRGRSATVTIEARGDLDCDGEYSTFTVIGNIDKRGSLTFTEPMVINETE